MVVNTKRRWTTDPRLHTITCAFAEDLQTDVDQKFDYPHTVETTDVKIHGKKGNGKNGNGNYGNGKKGNGKKGNR